MTLTTTLCHLWEIIRKDGMVLGFCDHDQTLISHGQTFLASSGLTARALQTGTGLSIDNSEVWGALSHNAIAPDDLHAGRYDGAQVTLYITDWSTPDARETLFRGHLGEISHQGGEFHAELLGLAAALGENQGQSYSRQCSAALGDKNCAFNPIQPGYYYDTRVQNIDTEQLIFRSFGTFDQGWFTHGHIEVLSGAAKGETALIRRDRTQDQTRIIELWASIRAPLAPKDHIRLVAGCDKAATTCRTKFGNLINFRGFPHLPSEDWLSAYPRQDRVNSGESLTWGQSV